MRRAKIVCTIGPATESYDQIRALIKAGMNVARINCSHGTHDEHESVYQNIRKAEHELGAQIAVLADLQGPKIRLGIFKNHEPVELKAGATFIITTEELEGSADKASTTFKNLPENTHLNDPILIDDGNVAVRVKNVTDTEVVTEVEVPGIISDHKGLNLPGVAVNVPALTEKDEDDLRWALKLGVDLVALSFVRSARDYDDVNRVMRAEGRRIPVIAKVEKPQAVERLNEIVRAFDGIMIGRGDLGVEMPLSEVPLVQKDAIDLARQNAKPVIVATQMLESMITHARPTRAEASDVANAVLDGTDAVMLSGETSVGQYPIDTVRTMSRIVESVEEGGGKRNAPMPSLPRTRSGIITKAGAEVGDELNAKFLVTFTESGDSARRMSRLHSPIPLIALTPSESVNRQLQISWGIRSFIVPTVDDTDEMISLADDLIKRRGLAEDGDVVVIISGAPVGRSGTTNQILVHRIGELDSVSHSGEEKLA